MTLPINPDTKVGALLDAYPGIDEVLISWVPAFAKLRNPVLRKTVAKVATLEQAARIGGVTVRDLVVKLREATGQSLPDESDIAHPAEASSSAPDWVRACRVRDTVDADAMLETGVHPIGKVRECAAALAPGEMVELKSSFRPEPLLNIMRRAGLVVYCEEVSPGRHCTYISRP